MHVGRFTAHTCALPGSWLEVHGKGGAPPVPTPSQNHHLLTVQVAHPASSGLCIRGSVRQGPAAARELGLQGGNLALDGSQLGVAQLELIPQPAQASGL